MEMALGKFPYPLPEKLFYACIVLNDLCSKKEETSFWELMDIINTKPAPTLPDEFSQEFQDFCSICLRKKAGSRTSATELLVKSRSVCNIVIRNIPLLKSTRAKQVKRFLKNG
jgi:hypothetical protein